MMLSLIIQSLQSNIAVQVVEFRDNGVLLNVLPMEMVSGLMSRIICY